MKKSLYTFLTLFIIGSLFFSTGCDKDDDNDNDPPPPDTTDKNTFTDSRDGEIYKFIEVGTQTWMAQNLRYKPHSGSMAYDDDTTYLATHGRLYFWLAAKTACPTGWHLPTDTEWQEFEKSLGMTSGQADSIGFRGYKEAEKIKKGGSSGFEALYSGYKAQNYYYDLGETAKFWTATPQSGASIWIRSVYKSEKRIERTFEDYNDLAYSVRCLKD